MANILIIDDEPYIREILSARVEMMDHVPITAPDLAQGLQSLGERDIDLVFLDVNLPDGNGLEILPEIRRNPLQPEVIIITAMGSTEGAEMAITNGAWDYIEKPFRKGELVLQVNRALEYRQARLKQGRPKLLKTAGIIGRSKAISQSLEQVAQCAGTLVNVLIQGESGTGKELFAKSVHDNCPNTPGAYIVVDCAAMPETLIESLLFGHRKGAFTGADKASDGLVTLADNGTLFLDEIGELPLSAQKTFLRVLQEKKYRPVGSATEISSNFRLISATNRDLEKMVGEGRFRNDLLHRLKTFVIELPPLRQRTEDIKDLAVHFTEELCNKHGIPQKALLPDTLDMLRNYDWPGNVRELVNVIEKTVLSDPEVQLIYPMQLPAHIRVLYAKKGLKHPDATPDTPTSPGVPDLPAVDIPDALPSFKEFRNQALDRIEAAYFRQLLAQCNWDMNRTADLSGLSKNRVYHFIRKHDLKGP